MKIRFTLVIIIFIVAIGMAWAISVFKSPKEPSQTSRLLSLNEAEQILGEPAFLADSIVTGEPGYTLYKCTYTAKDKSKDRVGNVYYLLEFFPNSDSAHSKYIKIKIANERNGIKTMHDIGDEGYFHTDKNNFIFIMARKSNAVLTMKVSKTTSMTSSEMFEAISRRIISDQIN